MSRVSSASPLLPVRNIGALTVQVDTGYETQRCHGGRADQRSMPSANFAENAERTSPSKSSSSISQILSLGDYSAETDEASLA